MKSIREFRPSSLSEIEGQTLLVASLRRKKLAFQNMGQVSRHLLFLGPSGVGKTTCAKAFAAEMGVGFVYKLAHQITSLADFLNIALTLKEGEIFFIDEIHALPRHLQEILYPVIEDFKWDSAHPVTHATIKNDLPRFTLIGATTHAGELMPAFINRFEEPYHLLPYAQSQLEKMITMAAKRIYDIDLSKQINVVSTLARLCRTTPRIAYNHLNLLMEAVFAEMGKNIRPEKITEDLLLSDSLDNPGQFFLKGIDPFIGLDRASRRYLHVLMSGKPTGADTIATMIGETKETVRGLIEPFLFSDISFMGNSGAFVTVTPRGRMITELGQQYLQQCRDLQISRGWFMGEKI